MPGVPALVLVGHRAVSISCGASCTAAVAGSPAEAFVAGLVVSSDHSKLVDHRGRFAVPPPLATYRRVAESLLSSVPLPRVTTDKLCPGSHPGPDASLEEMRHWILRNGHIRSVLRSFGVGLPRPAQVAVGMHHLLLRSETGTVHAWGSNSAGGCTWVPTAMAGDLRRQRVVQVAAGDNFSLALTAGGHLCGWGDGSSGELGSGLGGEDEVITPTLVRWGATAPFFVQVAAGGRTVVALADSTKRPAALLPSSSSTTTTDGGSSRDEKRVVDQFLDSIEGTSDVEAAAEVMRLLAKASVGGPPPQ